MRIGIISDTHGLLRPQVLDAFAHVDHILHAGDIGGEHVLHALRGLAPVTAVRGNVDGGMAPLTDDGAEAGYEIVRLMLDGLKILITHVLPRPGAMAQEVRASLEKDSADIVVFGHSHLPHDERAGRLWLLNPASAGPRRFDLPVSVALLQRGKSGWTAWHVPLDDRSVTSLGDRMNQLR